MSFTISHRIYSYTLFFVSVIFLIACGLPNALQATAVPTPMISTVAVTEFSMRTKTPTATNTLTEIPTSAPEPAHPITRVLILSIDGLRPDAILSAPMPNLLALMEQSAYTLNAQTVYPSVTLISHSSMLVGVCPSKHKVYWNDYLPLLGYAKGTDIFDLAHAAGLQTVMYVSKDKLAQITEPSSVDIFRYINDRDLVLTEKLLNEFPPDFGMLFIHFRLVDDMGHEHGWMSPEQLSVAFRADEALGLILAELDARDLRDETLIIITADHGGHNTIHGSSLPEDMTIPWIANGPDIQPGQLSSPVHTMDTAATAAYVLGLPIPAEWDGVPVYEALGLLMEKQSLPCD